MNQSIPKVDMNYLSSFQLDKYDAIIRFCMTDQVSKSINSVIEQNITPIAYAAALVKVDFHILSESIFKDDVALIRELFNKSSLDNSDRLLKGYMIELISQCAAILRVNLFFNLTNETITVPTSRESNLFPCLLLETLTNGGNENISGLCEFTKYANAFCKSFSQTAEYVDSSFIRRFSLGVGDIYNNAWILYDPIWSKVLLSSPYKLRVFRNFLYLFVSQSILSDNTLSSGVGTSRHELEADGIYFIELRESNTTTIDDVNDFLKAIDLHINGIVCNILTNSAYECDFDNFEQIFMKHANLHVTETVESERTPLMIINGVFDKALGGTWTPNDVVVSNITPVEYTSVILDTYKKSISEGVINLHFNKSDDVGKSLVDQYIDDPLFSGVISDYTMLLLSYTRYEHLSETKGNLEVLSTAHVLLTLPDSISGLSVINWIIPFHLDQNRHNLYENEIGAIQNLFRVLDNKMELYPFTLSDHFVNLLNDVEIRNKLRYFLYTIIESMYIENDKDYFSFINRSRRWWYEYIIKLTNYIESEVPIDEINNLLNKQPNLINSVLLAKSDIQVWTESFSNISITNETDDE